MANTQEDLQYEHSNEQALAIGQSALHYIISGEADGLPLDIRGAAVFGVISILRENDGAFYGDTTMLTIEQRKRLEEIETDIDRAVDVRAQYYPFGHKRDVYSEINVGVQKLHTSWGNLVNQSARKATFRNKIAPKD